jgi:hypothetical protein
MYESRGTPCCVLLYLSTVLRRWSWTQIRPARTGHGDQTRTGTGEDTDMVFAS